MDPLDVHRLHTQHRILGKELLAGLMRGMCTPYLGKEELGGSVLFFRLGVEQAFCLFLLFFSLR